MYKQTVFIINTAYKTKRHHLPFVATKNRTLVWFSRHNFSIVTSWCWMFAALRRKNTHATSTHS